VPDLIISDVMMPLMNGLELCQTIKENTATSHIPFILLTAKAQEADKIQGLETGADDYILKPFSVAELRLKVRNRLRLQENIRQRFQGATAVQNEEAAAHDWPEMAARDHEFLANLTTAIEANIDNKQLGVEYLTHVAHLSQRQLSRKLRAITGHTPLDLIRHTRLQKALQHLQAGMNVSEAAWEVGFDDPAYFGKVFKKHFGVPPSEYGTIGG
jgi:DNA-binding response OmpR family regulator